MSKILKLLRSLLPHIHDDVERDEAYLAASVDLQDFEHRMRAIESALPGGACDLGVIYEKTLFGPRGG